MLRFIVFAGLIINGLSASGQQAPSLDGLLRSFDQHRKQSLQEKLFVHTDQSFYLTGETVWFKIYSVDGTLHKPLDLSRVAYVELLDKEQRSVLQAKVTLSADGGNGALYLPASLNAGNYLLRAYTTWMKNYSADFFFEKTITIVNPFKPLNLPLLSQVPNYDVQFFPEGGQLVQGLPGRVAFKIADASGKGVAMQGYVLNPQNDTLVRFNTHRFGIGRFELTPAEGTTYRVHLRDPKGSLLTRPLPAIQPRGYTMRVEDASATQLKITVSTNVSATGPLYLLAHTRQEVKVAERLLIDRTATFLLDKNKLGEGVSHLTIFSTDENTRTVKPVCERLYFKRPTQQLAIELKANQPQYASRTAVKLDIIALPNASARNSSGLNQQAMLSMAVYRVDSLGAADSGNILSYLWMTSDLQGAIESPEYYLQAENAEVAQATDNLMLTHGWRRFKWSDVLNPTAASSTKPFIPERNGLIVEGTVTDPVTDAPVPNILTYLSTPGKPVRLYMSRSNAVGKVRFEVQDFYGPHTVIAQTNPEDSLYKVSIANPFSDALSTRKTPEFSIDESQADQLLSRSVAMQAQSTYWGDRLLQYRYPTVDSTAFYGKPSESYLLDAYTRFPRMEEVLREYVPGVLPRKRQGRFKLFVPNTPYGALFETPSLVLIDGVPVFDMDKVIEFSPLKVKKLDVITNNYLLGPARFTGVISFMTYKGDLAGFPLDPSLVKVDYEGLQLQREFYVPRYADRRAGSSRLPDTRTLLYWNPALKTDAQGKTQVEFPTSDEVGTFFVDVNGLTTTGVAGSGRLLFQVKNAPK